jgi:hypothetical protein
MSQTSQEPPRAPTSHGNQKHGNQKPVERRRAPLPTPAKSPSSAFQGWAHFGAVIMAMLGLFWAVLGLTALLDDAYFTVQSDELLVFHSLAPWGWAHLLGGLLALVAGVGILWSGSPWARTAGIVVAGLSAVVNLGFLGAAPVWATLLIALDVVVIYALTVHGRELEKR